MTSGFLLPLHSPYAALRRRLRRALDQRPDFDAARGPTWNSRRDGDRRVKILDLNDVVAQQLLACLGERAIGHEAFAAACPDTGGCRRWVQLRTGYILSSRLELFGELHVF